MAHVSKYTVSYFLLFVVFSLTAAKPADFTNETPEVSREGRQGILEIPKQVATVIRNFIDTNLVARLNFTTPKPNQYIPVSLDGSIIGHYVLQNFIATPPPAPPFKEQQTLNPLLFQTNDPTYAGSINTVPPLKPAVVDVAPPVAPPVATVGEVVPATVVTQEVVQPVVAPVPATTKAPLNAFGPESFPGLYNSYGVLLNGNNAEEVYYINPTATKESVIFPVEVSTVSPVASSQEATTVATETTTGESNEDEDGEEEEDLGRKNL